MAYKSSGPTHEGADYYFLIVRHIDRMSEGLKDGLDIGRVNTKTLVGYYEQILHLESLLVPFLTPQYYEKRKAVEQRLPGYSKTWSGDIKDQIEYFLAVSDLFQLLLIMAYKAGILRVKIRKTHMMELFS